MRPDAPTPACMPLRRSPASRSIIRSRVRAAARAQRADEGRRYPHPLDRGDAGSLGRAHLREDRRRIATRSGTARRRARSSVTWCGTCRSDLDLDRMQRATRPLLGEHDFAAFQGRGSDVKTTVRRVLTAEIVEMNIHTDQPIALSPLDGPLRSAGGCSGSKSAAPDFCVTWCATIVGTLVDIGRGQHGGRRDGARSSRRAIARAPDRPRRLTG